MNYSTKNLTKINSIKWYHTDHGTRLLLRCQTLTMTNIKITVTWDVAPCSVIHMYQYFGWAALYPKEQVPLKHWYLCPKRQNITSHKTIIFKLFSVQGLMLTLFISSCVNQSTSDFKTSKDCYLHQKNHLHDTITPPAMSPPPRPYNKKAKGKTCRPSPARITRDKW